MPLGCSTNWRLSVKVTLESYQSASATGKPSCGTARRTRNTRSIAEVQVLIRFWSFNAEWHSAITHCLKLQSAQTPVWLKTKYCTYSVIWNLCTYGRHRLCSAQVPNGAYWSVPADPLRCFSRLQPPTQSYRHRRYCLQLMGLTTSPLLYGAIHNLGDENIHWIVPIFHLI